MKSDTTGSSPYHTGMAPGVQAPQHPRMGLAMMAQRQQQQFEADFPAASRRRVDAGHDGRHVVTDEKRQRSPFPVGLAARPREK